MTASFTPSHALRAERDACLREAIRRRVERHRAERLRDLQDAVAATWSDGLPGIRRALDP
ncbi:MAG: hypothetical protein KIT14_10530 [bacterium]|nr:hypothetical protein [bacterium]